MLTISEFFQNYARFRHPPNTEQKQAIDACHTDALFVVAGPGTGKTTCITLRILKLMFVDGITPSRILATTFTKKAAAELRSRILSWGFKLIEELDADPAIINTKKLWAKSIDVNQVVTGTIDSICEQALRDHRDPGTQPPILIDDFVSKTLLLRSGLLDGQRYLDNDLDQYLLGIRVQKYGWNTGSKNDVVQSIWDRRHHDLIDWTQYASDTGIPDQNARSVLDEAIASYANDLSQRSMVDFALLEYEVLDRLRQGKLKDFAEGMDVILVDEYQDTNAMQEAIYFELAKACGGAMTVVGDDDQSLYRFRGATVELFSEFESRFQTIFSTHPQKIFLHTNYRSTSEIIEFVNSYAILDPGYQSVRVASKPPLDGATNTQNGAPILSMFRDDLDQLGHDLAAFIRDVFRGTGFTLPDGTSIVRDSSSGELGDCCLLCSSPAELSGGNKPRLPQVLRENLETGNPAIEVFNPRGQTFHEIEIVKRIGGLLLESLDPGGVIEAGMSGLSNKITDVFTVWRDEAIDYVSDGNQPDLEAYAMAWADRDPNQSGWEWPKSAPVLDLVYGLVHFFPELHDDPEGQVYLEVFTRQLSACEQVGGFKGRLVHDPGNQQLSDKSVEQLLRYFLAPIASGAIKVDEELIESFPRDRLSLLSIHQSKGLEFPMMIVDVGSDFKINSHSQAFKRFPKDGGLPHHLEDTLRPYSALGVPTRSALDRAFDDLYRQFFVAFSRPQDVLLLVGLTKSAPGGRVLNVATGYRRTGDCGWNPTRPYVEI